jgi:hypothetical protein
VPDGRLALFYLEESKMTQWELDREVATATGESLAEIRQQGFSLADLLERDREPEPRGPLVLNWDTGHPELWRN